MMSDVTQILSAMEQGSPDAVEQLLPLVYDELHKLAAAEMAREKLGQTLQTTALVHEAFLRMLGPSGVPSFVSRRHFFAAATQAMRHILVDRARARLALKRGGQAKRIQIHWDTLQSKYSDQELIDTHDLLDQLAETDGASAEVVRLHVFGGFTLEEAAAIMGISRATAYREWSFARAWLRDALASSASPRDAPE